MAVKQRTYGSLQFNSERKIWAGYAIEPHVILRAKRIFAKIGVTASTFAFADTAENCHELLWFMERYPLQVSDEDQRRLKRGRTKYLSTMINAEQILMPDYIPSPVQLNTGFVARDYQLKASELIHTVKKILIGDDIGIGKTLTAILSMLKPGALPAVVVVQTHLTRQWKNEIAKYTNLTSFVIDGRNYNKKIPGADVYIIRYSCIGAWAPVLCSMKFQTAVFDEIQELRHMDTGKYKGSKLLAESSEYTIGLSASPIYNYGDEIFPVMEIIRPGALGRHIEFEREWLGRAVGRHRLVENPKALGMYLRENFLMLRRTRAEVGRELPPVNTLVYDVEYDENEVQKTTNLARSLAMKVISGTFTERGVAARELDIMVRQQTGISKATSVAEFVRIFLENGDPVVLAGWHREVYAIWNRELEEFKPVMYTGSESPAQKEAAKEAFISGKTNLFILSLRSGIGLDGLQQRCGTVIFGELDWSPKVHEQVIGRVDRDGQENTVTAIYLVSDYGSDPLIVDMLGLKSSQSHAMINPDSHLFQESLPNDETRIKMLAQRFLKNH